MGDPYVEKQCQLCGGKNKVQIYCGGPAAYMCDSCRDIVYKWEERKKMRARIFKKIRETNEAKDNKP